MIETNLDHLVVAAADLNRGREFIEDLLGVETVAGGKHDAIGTHNRLLRLGVDQYLEIIAVDPEAKTPDRPRWFALDDPAMQSRLRECPALITWVARTTDINQTATVPPYHDMAIRDMARGDLRWRMTFTRDGRLLQEGTLPLMIEWQAEATPPGRLPDAGCVLERFVIQSPHAREVQHTLRDLNLPGVESHHGGRTRLVATISTPNRGEVRLASDTAQGGD